MPTTITTPDQQPLEQSVFAVTVQPKDEDGAAVTPSAMTWTLTDDGGTIVNSRDGVALVPATSVRIVLQGNDLAIGSPYFGNRRALLVEYTYTSSAGSNLPGKDVLYFEVQPLAGVS